MSKLNNGELCAPRHRDLAEKQEANYLIAHLHELQSKMDVNVSLSLYARECSTCEHIQLCSSGQATTLRDSTHIFFNETPEPARTSA